MWCDSVSENSLTQRSFVTPTSCKRVRTSIAPTLSRSNNNLIWNEVLTTSRTLFTYLLQTSRSSFILQSVVD